MPVFFVVDHLGRTLSTYRDLKTNEGAKRRAKRYHATAVKIEKWIETDGNPRPYYSPANKPTLTFNI